MAAPMARHSYRGFLSLRRIVAVSLHASTSSRNNGVCLRDVLRETTSSARHASQLVNKFGWIEDQAPVFGVSGDNITILRHPSEYCNTLKSLARNCKSRMVLTSLYLGTGKHETELVRAIRDALRDSPSLEVTILLDCIRGSRGQHNSRTMLTPLLQEFPDRINVALYHTPDLRGALKRLVPERFNEVIGVSHMKVFIFDDTIMTSGANLSNDYFENRQDRYIRIDASPHLVSFYEALVKTVCRFSFCLSGDDSLTVDSTFGIHPYEGDEEEFKMRAKELVNSVISPDRWRSSSSNNSARDHIGGLGNKSDISDSTVQDERNSADTDVISNIPPSQRVSHSEKSFNRESQKSSAIRGSEVKRLNDPKRKMHDTERTNVDTLISGGGSEVKRLIDTWISPLVQMGPLGITVDQSVTSRLLEDTDEGSRLHLASGYFNLTEQYKRILLRTKATCEILAASPQVNGFYGASGISGYIPDSYTYIAKRFYKSVCKRNLQDRIHLHEYYRDGWTFHAKGLWYYLPGFSLPSLSLIGSPNFGHRSVSRDLESQLVVMTTNENLQKQLHQEQLDLYSRAVTIDEETYRKPDRIVPLWAKIVTLLGHNFY